MHVGFVTGEYPPMQGGVGAFTRELARAIATQGHLVSVFTRARATIDESSAIRTVAQVGAIWGWTTIGQISSWVSSNQIDVVNIQYQTAAYNMHPSIHWLPAGLRTTSALSVVTFHDLRVPYLFPKAGPLRHWLVRKLARDASGVIATDRADQSTLGSDWHISHVRWIPIGSNVTVNLPEDYSPAAQRARLGLRNGQPLISYFGFLNETKGAIVLIDALAEIVRQGIDAHLMMIGGRAGSSDPTNFVYGELVDARIVEHKLSDRVHWSGFVDDRRVSELFCASDMTVLPYLDGASLRRGTLMAALAHGRAIVTTEPETHIPELDGVVQTVRPGDSIALAQSIAQLLKESQRRHTLEQAAIAASKHFTWDGIATRTIEFFNELLVDHRR